MTITIDEVFEAATQKGYTVYPIGLFRDRKNKRCCPLQAIAFKFNHKLHGLNVCRDLAHDSGLSEDWLCGVLNGFDDSHLLQLSPEKESGLKFGRECRRRALGQNSHES